MPKVKKLKVDFKTEVDSLTNSSEPDVKVVFEKLTPLEITGGLTVTREEFNQVVDKLNQVIKKVK